MFTGIVEAIGTIDQVDAFPGGVRLTVHAPALDFSDIGLGDSITHNGACMTVTALLPEARFTIDVSDESLRVTVGLDQPGNRVNLEKALKVNARLGGHLVSGHVDGIGDIVSFDPVGDNRELVILAPRALAKYLSIKGSVVVNGISLTTNFVRDVADGCEFSINVIPHTLEVTALGGLAAGDRVNLEIDLIARYVERMLSVEAAR
ncbi:Riboflavin synthase [Andreprevotia sp. IGB-42]|uniref:riboflavin synthase n=1 Tax=Andreprevotia sp. IGB-42 TaxID=2497473 RepID=UPI00135CB006|nr:riboflavin synthase [Andreprevotia sp. IGB-42]KAF0814158.1 Riboflavin synthase [Andreprevotia sp. IGB-42]